jgi:hypothetical protein
MIHHQAFRVSAGKGKPKVSGTQMAMRECGCRVYVGRRVDNGEAATVTRGCGPGHRELMREFRVAMINSLRNPTKRPLIDVVDEILMGLEEPS